MPLLRSRSLPGGRCLGSRYGKKEALRIPDDLDLYILRHIVRDSSQRGPRERISNHWALQPGFQIQYLYVRTAYMLRLYRRSRSRAWISSGFSSGLFFVVWQHLYLHCLTFFILVAIASYPRGWEWEAVRISMMYAGPGVICAPSVSSSELSVHI